MKWGKIVSNKNCFYLDLIENSLMKSHLIQIVNNVLHFLHRDMKLTLQRRAHVCFQKFRIRILEFTMLKRSLFTIAVPTCKWKVTYSMRVLENTLWIFSEILTEIDMFIKSKDEYLKVPLGMVNAHLSMSVLSHKMHHIHEQ
jgi:hypothetical protein